MNGQEGKRILVDGFDYLINQTDHDIAAIVTSIHAALTNKTVVVVPVFDANHNPMTLYLNGGLVQAMVIGPGDGPKPGELSP